MNLQRMKQLAGIKLTENIQAVPGMSGKGNLTTWQKNEIRRAYATQRGLGDPEKQRTIDSLFGGGVIHSNDIPTVRQHLQSLDNDPSFGDYDITKSPYDGPDPNHEEDRQGLGYAHDDSPGMYEDLEQLATWQKDSIAALYLDRLARTSSADQAKQNTIDHLNAMGIINPKHIPLVKQYLQDFDQDETFPDRFNNKPTSRESDYDDNSFGFEESAETGNDPMQGNSEEHSEEVQQALADFENVVMNLGMDPDDAYDRISHRLSEEGLSEFRQALESMGKIGDSNVDGDAEGFEYDDSMDGDHDSAMASAGHGSDEDYGDFGGHDEFDEAKSDKYFGSRDPDAELTGKTDEELRAVVISDIIDFIKSAESGNLHALRYDYVYYDSPSADLYNDIRASGDETLQRAYGAVRAAADRRAADGDLTKFIKVARSALKLLQGPVSEDFNNGYDKINNANGDDYFPNGPDSPVITNVGPSGSRQGDNPEQKKMQVAEVHKELIYGYRKYLKESTQ